MRTTNTEFPSRQTMYAQRTELVDAIRENLSKKFGAKVTTIGSMKKGDWDAFSDIDLWVSVPDDAKDELIRSRVDLFSDVGDDLITWERPSFAPIDGMHSIVLYDSDETTPIEVDYYISATSKDEYYKDFIHSSDSSTFDYTWATGEDDRSAPARIDYSSLVTLWAGKYWHRDINREEQLTWAWGRFREVADESGIRVNKEQKNDVGDLSTIMDHFHDHAILTLDEKRARACVKIADTLNLIQEIEARRERL